MFVCGGAQPGLPWARGPGLCGPHLWGGLPILTPSLPGVGGVAGAEIQLREVGGQPRTRRRRWAPGRTLATAQVRSGQARDHSCHPGWPAGGERWSR